MKPLSPKTQKLYADVLTKAFGDFHPAATPKQGVAEWPEPYKALLRAAVKRRCAESGHDASKPLSYIPRSYQIRKQIRIPGEDEARAYETAAAKLPPGKRALAMLPLALGLRAEEVCGLKRAEVQRAAKTGELIFLRKGGKEQTLRVDGALDLIRDLLSASRAHGKRLVSPTTGAWERAGEILSPASYHTQYRMLHRLVTATVKAAGLSHFSPHKLRHAFATRMNRDGAPIATIAAALGHSHVQTTQRYVHADATDIARFMRRFPGQETPDADAARADRDHT